MYARYLTHLSLTPCPSPFCVSHVDAARDRACMCLLWLLSVYRISVFLIVVSFVSWLPLVCGFGGISRDWRWGTGLRLRVPRIEERKERGKKNNSHRPVAMYALVAHVLLRLADQRVHLGGAPSQDVGEEHEAEGFEALGYVFVCPGAYFFYFLFFSIVSLVR